MSSRDETLKHIEEVQHRLNQVIVDLCLRGENHDQSKLQSPEAEVFEQYTAKLSGVTYGSEEYKGFLAEMKPALDHHYAANSHHPEHYRWHCAACRRSFSADQAPESDWGNGERHRFCPRCCGNGSVIWEAELMDKPDRGILGMSLADIIEMLADWDAASKRHADGDVRRSIEINQKRFGYSDDLKQILLNTLPLIEGETE